MQGEDEEKVQCKELIAENKDIRILLFEGKGLGYGAFGQCYLGYNPAKTQLVVIKEIFFKKKINYAQFKKDYKREIQNLYNASVKYKVSEESHIVNVEPFQLYSQTYGTAYMVMEYCQGGSLQGLMTELKNKQKWFTFDEACTIIIDLIEGYYQLSSVPIIHQDIKPANILINKNRFKIGDFGLSYRLGADKIKLGGSPYYNAPQKYKQIVDVKSDVFALGIIFYQLFFEEYPYFNDDDYEAYIKTNGDMGLNILLGKVNSNDLFREFLNSRHLKEHPVKVTVSAYQKESFGKLRKLILKMIDLNYENRLKFIQVRQELEKLKIERKDMIIQEKKIPRKYQFDIVRSSDMLGMSINKSIAYYEKKDVPKEVKMIGQMAIRVNSMSLFLFELTHQLESQVERKSLKAEEFPYAIAKLKSLNYCLTYHEYCKILEEMKEFSDQTLSKYYKTTEDMVINNTKNNKTTLQNELGSYFHIRSTPLKQYYQLSKNFLENYILSKHYCLGSQNKYALKLIELLVRVVELGPHFITEQLQQLKREKRIEFDDMHSNRKTLNEVSKELSSAGIKLLMIECEDD